MSELNLKPCAHCGGTANLTKGYATEEVWPHGAFHRVFCGTCQVRQLFYRTPAEAVAAWNRRATQPASAPAAIKTWRERIDPTQYQHADSHGKACLRIDAAKAEVDELRAALAAVGAPQGQAEPACADGSACVQVTGYCATCPHLQQKTNPRPDDFGALLGRLMDEFQKHPQLKPVFGREALILRCVDAARRAAPALPTQAVERDAWQPIQTAPQDGYMLLHEDGAIRAMLRINGAWHQVAYPVIIGLLGHAIVGDDAKRLLPAGYRLGLYDGCCENPTHWMPMPEGPAIASMTKETKNV